MALTTQRRIEYRRFRNGVNRLGALAQFFSMGWTFIPLSGGCVTTPDAEQAAYWIAVRYDVEPRLTHPDPPLPLESVDPRSARPAIGSGLSQKDDAIRSDLMAIAKLGFNGVVLHHVEDGDRWRLLELSNEAGLKAAVPDRRFDRFVVTGELPPNCRDGSELVRDINLPPRATNEVVHHPAFNGYVVEGGRGSASRERSRSLRAQLARQGVNCIGMGNEDAPPAIIDAAAVRVGLPGRAVERVLAQYHAALSAGQTDGVIVDRFLRLPGDPPGLTAPDETLLPAHSSAITALIQRARLWGPKLKGLPSTTLDAETTNPSSLVITALGRGSPRYLLFFNASMDSFAREDVRLPASILERTVLRAVEVPPSSDRVAGRVVYSQRGHLSIPIELRPGDAALFEVFSTQR